MLITFQRRPWSPSNHTRLSETDYIVEINLNYFRSYNCLQNVNIVQIIFDDKTVHSS